ncbi:MAG: hypothetical protein LC808_28810, partial [Actinobacteria bacterium]|nr:hypothetical protein [Actinomycetota bacterium]
IMSRDRAAFLETLDRSSSAFVQRQENLFDWMKPVPLSSYELTATWDRYGDMVRPSDVARYPEASEVAIPVTEERYAIAGFDPQRAAEDIFYTFVKVEGRWLIAEDTDLDDLSFYSARHLWDFGPIDVDRSRHFLLLSHPCDGSSDGTTGGCQPFSQGVVDIAERSLQRTESLWSLPWKDHVVILVPGSSDELSRIIQATFELDDFVAFAYSTVDVEGGYAYTGHRIILNPSSIAGRGEMETMQILSHELTHVASRPSAGPFIPIFIEEGVAEYVGYGGRPSLSFFDERVAAGLFDRELPEDFEFLTGGGTAIYNSYQEGQSAVRFFVNSYGLKTFLRLYEVLGRGRIEPGLSRWHVDRALRKTIGIGFNAFEEAWADSIAG